ncbi:MAG: ATP-binding cassette domain-containing protein [Candidatus Marinimicrobia bacterium]|jgi:cell division transport system ATP-binding protein|nr:ATP-binding cassette domain-containing protein [Candidatus Neomarinimicrobiota bacterium]MBT5955129.1 ATP-binding cassette domain-containing protein [Candidatus Neomarinimicrobiota bacterium]MBT6871093.1 ATP-binding cassette domain-containing protein [Candidatus Neomarinimicrobiota bacterium]MBT7377154.1 ATP-binding cassette domain-containing protein [Candidatus Neomarinimicrobiota bacterium]|tara:strand:- start:12489 stop:13142 length:654 start_codon:yes stop_codon:yes gene_type:complete
MIQFENVTATYADDVGIFDLSFHIEKGEMVFLMGPTGAGKSTVLRTIYKDILLNDGSLYIDGQDITDMRSRKIPYYRRKIGMIFQDFRLIEDRTVFENVALPLNILGLPNKEIKSKVSEILEKVGLDSVTKMRPSQLSGGEQQRVSIARALVKDPVVILADEPTGNLDPNVSDEILDLLELATNNGTSVLMSTHNFPLIRPRKKRYIELSDGRLVQK